MNTEVARAQRQWYLIDATDMVLGRMASEISKILRGKNKPLFTPNVDAGDFVVVINANSIRLSGKKLEKKIYYRHTDYPGGIREKTAAKMLEDSPEDLIRLAVKGMLPKNRLSRRLVNKLKIYAGPEHPHIAQKPEPLVLAI